MRRSAFGKIVGYLFTTFFVNKSCNRAFAELADVVFERSVAVA
jgi:hypothetical protein